MPDLDRRLERDRLFGLDGDLRLFREALRLLREGILLLREALRFFREGLRLFRDALRRFREAARFLDLLELEPELDLRRFFRDCEDGLRLDRLFDLSRLPLFGEAFLARFPAAFFGEALFLRRFAGVGFRELAAFGSSSRLRLCAVAPPCCSSSATSASRGASLAAPFFGSPPASVTPAASRVPPFLVSRPSLPVPMSSHGLSSFTPPFLGSSFAVPFFIS